MTAQRNVAPRLGLTTHATSSATAGAVVMHPQRVRVATVKLIKET
ncbi:hypothetical protein [Lacticaseibacillus absianus]|nr:hypothetical protein [Lacticaseibacillus absianus]